MDAAIALAAHDTLSALFPSQSPLLDRALLMDVGAIPSGRSKDLGIVLGRSAASAILTLRSSDGSQHREPRVGIEFLTSNAPGKWRQDPVSRHPLALGAYWGRVRPFVLRTSAQFRTPAPPSLAGAEYAAAFHEVQAVGGDGLTTPTLRTPDQTHMGLYWAYDGMPSLCAPPRLYNQITVQIAEQMRTELVPLARLLALVNVAMADAGIAIWESKFYDQFWRPV